MDRHSSSLSNRHRDSLAAKKQDSNLSHSSLKKKRDNDRKKSKLQEEERDMSPTTKGSDSRPPSSTDVVFESKRKKKKGTLIQGGHNVTFTVTIAKAIPRVDGSTDDEAADGRDTKKKKRIVEAPRPQTYYHSEYSLLPEDDEPIKTDIVTFGMAAKIYTEKMEAKVLKTWQDGDLTWIAWTHCHNMTITEEILLKLFEHTVQLRIWDTRDKLSTRAKFDRPKALRLPQSKDDTENVGVKALVLKQSESYLEMQPKKTKLDRPLPMQPKLPTLKDDVTAIAGKTERTGSRKGREKEGTLNDSAQKLRESVDTVGQNVDKDFGTPNSFDPNVPPTSDGGPLRSYSRLGRLVGADTVPESADRLAMQERESTHATQASRSRSQQRPSSKQKPRFSIAAATSAAHLQKLKAAASAAADDASSVAGPSASKPHEKGRKLKKAEAAAAAAQAEHARKYGICTIKVNMAQFFATGVTTVTSRLSKPLPTLQDALMTITLSGPLMSDEVKRKLNPLVIKVHSATKMPNTPLSYADLRLKCQPAFVKYKFFKLPVHRSLGREQDEAVYWDDVHVVLTGTLDQSEFREYLTGPLVEIEVHDRDRIIEKQKLKPTLFGDDLEDEKISNVGRVTSKRTLYNPFESRDEPWDPYGIAKFDMSQLLEGQKVMYLTAPIHMCPTPDPLGIRDGKVDGKLLGIAGAVDGPSDKPLPAGHYLESNAMLKIKVEITYPLTTPEQLAANNYIPTTFQCPYGRIIFIFPYKSIELLHRLQSLLMKINSEALDLSHLPPHIIEAALSTYKLSLEQQESRELNIVTGFQLMDGKQHLFILEGLRDGAVKQLWEDIPKEQNQELDVLYNSDLSFHQRLYGPLDVDLCRIKLHQALEDIIKQPLLYVRDLVPKPCFEALIKLDQLCHTTKLRDAIRNDLLPTAEMVVSMSREFGVPLTAEDFEELAGEPKKVVIEEETVADFPHTSRMWTPIDYMNDEYGKQILLREEGAIPQQDYINENKHAIKRQSDLNHMERSKTMPLKVHSDVKVAHNYSIQTLNSTDQAKEMLIQELAKYPDTQFTYCPDFHHSMTVSPVNVKAAKKQAEKMSKEMWKTPTGWNYPGKKTMRESNVHPQRPHEFRVKQLYEPWEENTLHSNILKPTLERECNTWSKRKADIDLWTRPNPVFGKLEPITIHLAGQKRKEESLEALQHDHSIWQSKVIVENAEMSFHRCAPETEMRERGFKSSNQIDRLQGLLKDPHRKLALCQPYCSEAEIPPLNVVLNPSVDTAANKNGQVVCERYEDSEAVVKGFTPGPYTDHSWLLEKNVIPVMDYRHDRFNRIKGQDFNVYYKERNYQHKQKIRPLSDKEYSMSHLFRWPGYSSISAPPDGKHNSFIIPETAHIQEFKDRYQMPNTLDSGIGTFINEQEAV